MAQEDTAGDPALLLFRLSQKKYPRQITRDTAVAMGAAKPMGYKEPPGSRLKTKDSGIRTAKVAIRL